MVRCCLAGYCLVRWEVSSCSAGRIIGEFVDPVAYHGFIPADVFLRGSGVSMDFPAAANRAHSHVSAMLNQDQHHSCPSFPFPFSAPLLCCLVLSGFLAKLVLRFAALIDPAPTSPLQPRPTSPLWTTWSLIQCPLRPAWGSGALLAG